MIGWIILGAVLLFVAVLLVRTMQFKPKADHRAAPTEVKVDGDRAIESLAQMVRCKTVSSHDKSLVDEGEFDKFRALLKKRYPNVYKTCTFEQLGDGGLLYRWAGRSDKAPAVLMSHYDVVPANEDAWQKPAFAGVVEDGVLWGRGTLDTKGTLCGIMESAEQLMADGFTPENDIYFSFGGDEEISGNSTPSIVAALGERGIRPELVVDEGGAVVEGVFPGVSEKCALIGIAEKGMMDVEFKVKSAGGHASAPPPHGPIGKLSQMVVDMENKPFPARLSDPIAQMFDTLGRRSGFAMRLIFANLWCFMPVLNLICKKSGGELNAMVRTTCAFTQMQGSSARNVLPPEATVGANFRLMCGDTVDSALAYVKQVVNNDDVEITLIQGNDPSPVSNTNSPGYTKLKAAIEQTWTDAVVAPYLMLQCSDSRHYCAISDKVMRFSAMELTKEERGMIHANDERIPTRKIVETVAFFTRLMVQL